MLIPVQFIDQFSNRGPPFSISIVLVDTLLVGLLDRDHGISGQVLKFCKDSLGHFPDTILNEPRIFMRGKDYCPLVSPLEKFIDPGAHRFLENVDDFLKVHILVIVGLDTEETLATLVVGGHRHCCEELLDLIFIHIKALKYPHSAFLHDILGTGTGGHTRDFSTDAFPDDRAAECPSGNSACMDLDNFMACRMTDRGLALHHVLAAHKHFRPVRIFMAVEQFSCHNAAEFFNHVDIPFYCLLEHFIDYLEIPGKVCSFQAAGQIDEHIEIGDENDWSLSISMNFDEFFHIFNANTGEVYPDVG